MPENLLSVRPGSYGKAAGRAYEEMEKIGLKHVEVCVGHPSLVPAERAKYESHGITASSLTGRIDVKSRDCALLFEPWAVACQSVGAKVMFVSVKAEETDLRLVYTRLYECGEIAKKYDVTVCLETHPDLIADMDVALETMAGVDHPNIRINYDTANIYYYNEGIDGLEELKKVIDYVGAIHLKETNGKPKTWYFPTFGDEHGVVKWEETFKVLNDSGFYGPFTMEIEGCEGERETFTEEDYIKRVADSVQFLRDKGLVP